ncbi:CinA family protein [Ornithinimicrobium pratense]|uniref:Nicotinamide-nucleotide amidohydrolase family protein n=1 Tax=Ornithinimicrobium pratense TaxID=2593973 RepID=A0A5J6V7G1_9MICO|nr:nicotinamide-nucleotide amidohydrolase family protein [Ornithinimicrobium pratense]QFG69086.1 nicotinamide-nucleotide amidohydrolase family protein [Ornithinimicrobium pratense]
MTAAPLPGRVLAALQDHGHTIAVAESLTGGLVAAALTDVPGASATVRGGVVAYVDEVKAGVLGIPGRVLEEDGAVSRACAVAMAQGVRDLLGADWGLATTGVAGPGPSGGKAAGSVHIAVAGEQRSAHRALTLRGTRTQVRADAVTAVLELLLEVLVPHLSGGRGTVEDHSRQPLPGS